MKKSRFACFLLLAILFLPAQIFAVVTYEKGDKLNVLALSGLRLRASPGGNVITSIPYGSELIMLESRPTGASEMVENIPGKWAKATWNGQEGYVFDGFLSFLPAPDENMHELEAYANQYFKKKGDPVTYETGEEETHHSTEIQFYLFRGALMELRTDVYYESFRTLLFFGDGVSTEEAYLLSKALVRDRIEDAMVKGQRGEFTLSADDSGQTDQKPDTNYYKFRGTDQTYELPPDCGFDEFGYGQFEGMLYLSRAGGC